MTLPTTMQSRSSMTPLQARVLLVGMPKAGKTTLLAEWAPENTLIIDTHKGTEFLAGEHWVQHVASWSEFVKVVDDLVSTEHTFSTVGLDLVDDLWKFADAHVAARKGVAAAGLVEYGKGTAEAEGIFREQIGRLFASPLGIWFVGHTTSEENGPITRYVPNLDKKVRTFVEGPCAYILLLETLGAARALHTQPSGRFQAGSRTPLPEPMEPSARELYRAMLAGMRVTPSAEAAAAEPVEPAPEPEKAKRKRAPAGSEA